MAAPTGYEPQLVLRPITRESIPDLVVEMAEGRLIFVAAEVMRRESDPPLDLQAEDLMSNDPAVVERIERYLAVTGKFWQRRSEPWQG